VGSLVLSVAVAILALMLAACESAESPPDTSPTTRPTTTALTATPSNAPAPDPLPPGLTEARVTRVVDGDTIHVEIQGQEFTVRYIGIDTPETVHPSQPVGCFGPEASARNKEMVDGKTVGLERDVSETDAFGRLLRYVYVGGDMVNAALVRDGYAQSSTYPPDVKHQATFIELQRQAREAGRGLWGASCSSPTAAPPPPVGGVGGCEFSANGNPMIKGNINREGEKIYHVPGQRHYDETVINEGAGERWFCTEGEAVESGWRKAKV